MLDSLSGESWACLIKLGAKNWQPIAGQIKEDLCRSACQDGQWICRDESLF